MDDDVRHLIAGSISANSLGLPDGALRLTKAGERGRLLMGRMHAMLKPRFPSESDRDARLMYLSFVLGRKIDSIKNVTVGEAVAFCDIMKDQRI